MCSWDCLCMLFVTFANFKYKFIVHTGKIMESFNLSWKKYHTKCWLFHYDQSHWASQLECLSWLYLDKDGRRSPHFCRFHVEPIPQSSCRTEGFQHHRNPPSNGKQDWLVEQESAISSTPMVLALNKSPFITCSKYLFRRGSNLSVTYFCFACSPVIWATKKKTPKNLPYFPFELLGLFGGRSEV